MDHEQYSENLLDSQIGDPIEVYLNRALMVKQFLSSDPKLNEQSVISWHDSIIYLDQSINKVVTQYKNEQSMPQKLKDLCKLYEEIRIKFDLIIKTFPDMYSILQEDFTKKLQVMPQDPAGKKPNECQSFNYGQIINQKEDRQTEYKNYQLDSFSKDQYRNIIRKSITSFLNSQGGTLYIGIRDYDQSVEGIDLSRKNTDELKLQITSIRRDIEPDSSQLVNVDFIPIKKWGAYSKGKWVVRIKVQQGEVNTMYAQKVLGYNYSLESYIREDGSCQKFEVGRFLTESKKIHVVGREKAQPIQYVDPDPNSFMCEANEVSYSYKQYKDEIKPIIQKQKEIYKKKQNSIQASPNQQSMSIKQILPSSNNKQIGFYNNSNSNNNNNNNNNQQLQKELQQMQSQYEQQINKLKQQLQKSESTIAELEKKLKIEQLSSEKYSQLQKVSEDMAKKNYEDKLKKDTTDMKLKYEEEKKQLDDNYLILKKNSEIEYEKMKSDLNGVIDQYKELLKLKQVAPEPVQIIQPPQPAQPNNQISQSQQDSYKKQKFNQNYNNNNTYYQSNNNSNNFENNNKNYSQQFHSNKNQQEGYQNKNQYSDRKQKDNYQKDLLEQFSEQNQIQYDQKEKNYQFNNQNNNQQKEGSFNQVSRRDNQRSYKKDDGDDKQKRRNNSAEQKDENYSQNYNNNYNNNNKRNYKEQNANQSQNIDNDGFHEVSSKKSNKYNKKNKTQYVEAEEDPELKEALEKSKTDFSNNNNNKNNNNVFNELSQIYEKPIIPKQNNNIQDNIEEEEEEEEESKEQVDQEYPKNIDNMTKSDFNHHNNYIIIYFHYEHYLSAGVKMIKNIIKEEQPNIMESKEKKMVVIFFKNGLQAKKSWNVISNKSGPFSKINEFSFIKMIFKEKKKEHFLDFNLVDEVLQNDAEKCQALLYLDNFRTEKKGKQGQPDQFKEKQKSTVEKMFCTKRSLYVVKGILLSINPNHAFIDKETIDQNLYADSDQPLGKVVKESITIKGIAQLSGILQVIQDQIIDFVLFNQVLVSISEDKQQINLSFNNPTDAFIGYCILHDKNLKIQQYFLNQNKSVEIDSVISVPFC